MMKVQLVAKPLTEIDADALLLPVPEDAEGAGPWRALDEALDGALGDAVGSPSFEGKRDQLLALPTYGRLPCDHLLLVGLGDDSDPDDARDAWRGAVARGCTEGRDLGARRVAVALPSDRPTRLEEDGVAAVEAARLGCYRFLSYRGEESEDRREIDELQLVVRGRDPDAGLRGAVGRAETVADSACWVRDLVNTPGNDKRPPALARRAVEMAEAEGLEHEYLDASRCEELGLEALLAVGSGSGDGGRPGLVIVEHGPTGIEAPPVLLVGKGVTFDSGGISIKPSKNMHEMKGDMAGAAAVLGTLRAAARLDLPLRIIGVTPLAENLPSSSSYRPGDVVRAYGGTTIEVINTDAEGRLILADALAYAGERYEPDRVIDLATLTGACVVALGSRAAGLMSNDDDLAASLLEAGSFTGERLWRLPLWSSYDELIDSDIATVKNSGGRPAGAITAAKLLERFVPDDTAWAHLDIAGPAFLSEARPYEPKGATGFGVRLLTRWLERLAATGRGDDA